MDAITRNLAVYVRDKGINIAKMARDTGISYMALYDSLSNPARDRDIKGRELVAVCKFLEVNPMDFANIKED